MFEKNSIVQIELILLVGAFCCLISPVMAAESTNASYFKVITSVAKGSELQLDAQKASLPQILENLSKKTHIPIHYSALPEGLVSATCVGSTLKKVLECLLAHKVDLAFRESPKAATNSNEVAEVWITGSSLSGNDSTNSDCAGRAERAEKELQALKQKFEAQDSTPDMTDDFLKMSESQKSGDRAAAIGALSSSKRKDDPAVKAVLEKALTDQNAGVRAQAVSTMAQFGGDDVTAILQAALADESVDVRLMAVSSITDNIGLLQQAINDSDETVRTLAGIKLNEIQTKAGK